MFGCIHVCILWNCNHLRFVMWLNEEIWWWWWCNVNWTRDLSIASPTLYSSANTQHNQLKKFNRHYNVENLDKSTECNDVFNLFRLIFHPCDKVPHFRVLQFRKSVFTIKNGSKIRYETKQDSGNTYVKTEEHTKLHVSSVLNKIVINQCNLRQKSRRPMT